MEITRAGSRPSAKGPTDWFTGMVRIDPLIQTAAPARVGGAAVTFEPGARTAWHTHPLGQTLIVTGGCGRAQRWGGAIEEIRPAKAVNNRSMAALPVPGSGGCSEPRRPVRPGQGGRRAAGLRLDAFRNDRAPGRVEPRDEVGQARLQHL